MPLAARDGHSQVASRQISGIHQAFRRLFAFTARSVDASYDSLRGGSVRGASWCGLPCRSRLMTLLATMRS
eukprot:12019701-Alexandrium_andersonii.AAC.1